MFSNVLKNIFYKMQLCKVNKNTILLFKKVILTFILIAAHQNADAQNKHLIRVNMNECMNWYAPLYDFLRLLKNERVTLLTEERYKKDTNFVREKLYLHKFNNVDYMYSDSLIAKIKIGELSEVFKLEGTDYVRLGPLAGARFDNAPKNNIDTTVLKGILEAGLIAEIPHLSNRNYCLVHNAFSSIIINIIRKSDLKVIPIPKFDSALMKKCYAVALKNENALVRKQHDSLLELYPNLRPQIMYADLLNDSIAIYAVSVNIARIIGEDDIEVGGTELILVKHLNYEDSFVVMRYDETHETKNQFFVYDKELVFSRSFYSSYAVAKSYKIDKNKIVDGRKLPFEDSSNLSQGLQPYTQLQFVTHGDLFTYEHSQYLFNLKTLKAIPIPFREQILPSKEHIQDYVRDKIKEAEFPQIFSVFNSNDSFTVIYNYKTRSYIMKFTEKNLISNTRLELPIKENMKLASALQLTDKLMVYYAVPYGGYHFYEFK
jgi:hypothetical protein